MKIKECLSDIDWTLLATFIFGLICLAVGIVEISLKIMIMFKVYHLL